MQGDLRGSSTKHEARDQVQTEDSKQPSRSSPRRSRWLSDSDLSADTLPVEFSLSDRYRFAFKNYLKFDPVFHVGALLISDAIYFVRSLLLVTVVGYYDSHGNYVSDPLKILLHNLKK